MIKNTSYNMFYLTNKKWITAFKSHKLIKIEKDIENVSWEFASFQIVQCDIFFPLKEKYGNWYYTLFWQANEKKI